MVPSLLTRTIPASFRIWRWWETAGLDRDVLSVISPTRTPEHLPILIISRMMCCRFSSPSAVSVLPHAPRRSARSSIVSMSTILSFIRLSA